MMSPNSHYKKIIRLIFANPNGWQNDLLVRDNMEFLKRFSKDLHDKHPIPKTDIFRGLLLSDKYTLGDTIKPINGRFYVSFSSSIEVAKEFANPHHDLSFLLAMHGKTKGFVVKHRPVISDIFYHWSWGSLLGIYENGYKSFFPQKEVILFNTKHFTLGPS